MVLGRNGSPNFNTSHYMQKLTEIIDLSVHCKSARELFSFKQYKWQRENDRWWTVIKKQKKQQTNTKLCLSKTWLQYLCAAGTVFSTPVLEPHDGLWLLLHSLNRKLGPLIFSCKNSPYCLAFLLAKLSPFSISWQTCLFTQSSHASFGKSTLYCNYQGWVAAPPQVLSGPCKIPCLSLL